MAQAVAVQEEQTSPEDETVWTAEDLLALADDEKRYELVRGELTMMHPASARHGKIAMRIGQVLANFVEDQGLGTVYAAETGFELSPDPLTIRAPDVAFIRRERIPAEGEPEGFWAMAPDLVIEIISPSETAQAIHEKVVDYLQAGTQLVWLVYPTSQSVMVYRPPMEGHRLVAEDNLDGGEVIPGFTYPLQKLFT